MDPVRFGVVGLGMGYNRSKVISNTENAELTAVCDLREERAREVADEFGCAWYTDYDEMLAESGIDVAYVVTPSGAHLAPAEKAANAGKHVITTKPMEVTVERSQQMIDVCRDNGVKLIVDFQMRYEHKNQQWKAAIEAGELGDIVFAEARCRWWRAQSYYDSGGGWRGTWDMDGGGSMANQGIHAVDLFIWLAGEATVKAAQAGVYAHDIETEDYTAALLELANGRPALIMTTTNYHIGDEYGIMMAGTKGSVTNIKGFQVKFEDNDRTELATPVPDWPKSAAADMVRVLRDGAEPHSPGELGIQSMKLMEAIYHAAGIR